MAYKKQPVDPDTIPNVVYRVTYQRHGMPAWGIVDKEGEVIGYELRGDGFEGKVVKPGDVSNVTEV
jgi:hypothetical protein